MFADLTGIWSGTVRRLVSGESKPTFDMLLRMCPRLNITVTDLLSDTGNEVVLERRHLLLGQDSPYVETKTPKSEVESRLRVALQEHPPPSMEAVARRMGYSPVVVKSRFPKLCKEVISRYKEYIKNKHASPKEIRKALRSALKENPAPSLQRVIRRLGCRDTGYYYYSNYYSLCLSVAQRYKAHRNRPFDKDIDRERLENALLEEPPPSFSEIARRLNHNREFVRKKFPELSKAITFRHIYYQTARRKEKAERLRHEIRAAISQIIASGLYISEARIKEHLRLNLSGPGRDSLFKRALLEIKSEMGIE